MELFVVSSCPNISVIIFTFHSTQASIEYLYISVVCLSTVFFLNALCIYLIKVGKGLCK